GVPPGIQTANVFGLFLVLLFGWFLVAALLRGEDRRALRQAAVLLGAALLAVLALVWPIGFCVAGIAAFLGAATFLAGEAEDRLPFGFAGAGFFLVAFAELFFIYDRMNTYFKLFLEAWILFAVAAAALVFGSRERRGAWARWPLALRLPALAAFGLALFTIVTISRGYFLGRNRPPGESTAPTLDGMA